MGYCRSKASAFYLDCIGTEGPTEGEGDCTQRHCLICSEREASVLRPLTLTEKSHIEVKVNAGTLHRHPRPLPHHQSKTSPPHSRSIHTVPDTVSPLIYVICNKDLAVACVKNPLQCVVDPESPRLQVRNRDKTINYS